MVPHPKLKMLLILKSNLKLSFKSYQVKMTCHHFPREILTGWLAEVEIVRVGNLLLSGICTHILDMFFR